MQRAAQGADRSGHAAVHIGQGRGTNAGGEGRGIEFVFRVQDQRHVHGRFMQCVGLFTAQHMQEVRTNRVIIGALIDTHAVVTEAIPVADDRRECGKQTIGGILLLIEAGFCF